MSLYLNNFIPLYTYNIYKSVYIIYFYFALGNNLVETVSELIYTPKTERDYGTLACWGKNSIGKQSEPCLFQVVPAGKYIHKNILYK